MLHFPTAAPRLVMAPPPPPPPPFVTVVKQKPKRTSKTPTLDARDLANPAPGISERRHWLNYQSWRRLERTKKVKKEPPVARTPKAKPPSPSIPDEARVARKRDAGQPPPPPPDAAAVREAELRRVFDAADKSGDGSISIIEAVKALRGDAAFGRALGFDGSSRVRQEDGTRDRLVRAFGALDVDGDKMLSWDEFRAVGLKVTNTGMAGVRARSKARKREAAVAAALAALEAEENKPAPLPAGAKRAAASFAMRWYLGRMRRYAALRRWARRKHRERAARAVAAAASRGDEETRKTATKNDRAKWRRAEWRHIQKLTGVLGPAPFSRSDMRERAGDANRQARFDRRQEVGWAF